MTTGYHAIVCLGDSITSVEEDPSYVTFWQERCDRELGKGRVNLISAGVNGDTAHDGYNRLEKDVFPFHPDLVTIMFGHNEVYQGISPLRYRHDLEQIIESIRRYTAADIWLLSPNQVAEPSIGTLYRPYLEVARRVAEKQSVPFVDVWAEFDGKDLTAIYTWQLQSYGISVPDHIHPNALGHRLIADFLMYRLLSA